MKLAYSTNAYRCFSLGDAVGRIADLGFAGLEIMADLPHAWPTGTTAEEAAAIREQVRRASLTITNVNACTMNGVGDFHHPSWIEPDTAYRRKRLEHTAAALRLAARLGAPSVTTQPGGPMEPDMSYEWARDTFVAGLKEVLVVAEDLGVQLLVEPQPWQLIQGSGQFLDLAERVGSARFGLDLDIGQLYCLGEPMAETIQRLHTLTRHIHLEDISDTRAYEPLVPGRGAINFADVLQAIETSGYAGWITVQLYPYIDDPDAAGAEAKVRLEWAAKRVASCE